MTIAESDWKKFKKVRGVALERLSQRILEECKAICDDDSQSAHEKYGDLYGLIQKRNREMAAAFDDFRRSTAIQCLMLMSQSGLLREGEISEFSHEVQRLIARK